MNARNLKCFTKSVQIVATVNPVIAVLLTTRYLNIITIFLGHITIHGIYFNIVPQSYSSEMCGLGHKFKWNFYKPNSKKVELFGIV